MRADTILRFISVFQSDSNNVLFNECACYWFSLILHERFKDSTIVYDPHSVHFATRIGDGVYDISGKIKYNLDYVDWESYLLQGDDADAVVESCILITGGR